MGVLLRNLQKNDYSKLSKWWSKPIAYDHFSITKSDTNILIDDMEYYLPKIDSITSTKKKKKFFGSNYTFINDEDNYLPKNNRITNSSETQKKKFYGGDYVIDDESKHFLPKTSKIIYSPKFKKKFYGVGVIHGDISMNNLIAEKSIEEVTLKNSVQTLSSAIEEALGSKNAAEAYIDFTKFKLQDLKDLFLQHNVDTYSCAQIADDFEFFKNTKNRLRAINNRIKVILNKIREFGRNLKEHFTKNHSFHFKNLDDYHSLNLVNSYIVS